MLLIFLLIFAFLALAVVQQLERGRAKPAPDPSGCPGCGQPVEHDWLICPRCRQMLQATCDVCRQRLPVFHRFCTACGAPRSTTFGELADDDPV